MPLTCVTIQISPYRLHLIKYVKITVNGDVHRSVHLIWCGKLTENRYVKFGALDLVCEAYCKWRCTTFELKIWMNNFRCT